MLEAGVIDNAQFEEALTFATPRQSQRDTAAARKIQDIAVPGDYVAEMARQIAVEQFGERAYELGIRIVTTVTRADQEAAYAALRRGVIDYDRRHGYRGPESFADLPAGTVSDEQLDEALGEVNDHGDLLAAVVLKASTKEVVAYRRGQEIRITGKGLGFVAPMLAEKAPQSRRVRRGAIIRLRSTGKDAWEIAQLPEVQAALVAIDSHSGAVRALIGGFDFNRNKFNHVTQAVRQPGSSFKPFIFSAALDRNFGPGNVLDDAPLYYPAGVTGSKAWEPKNYDGRYAGPMTLRDALARSKNMVSIRLLEQITPEYARDYLSRFGFDPAQNPPYLTMALGAGAATPWQMAAGFAVFANGGYRIEPYVVKEIYDGSGRLIARTDPPVAGESAPRVIDARNAWLMDSMMRDVVQRGTATRARVLKRNDLAGKTGTTNDYVDAWFCGYNPDLVTVSWVGHSQPRNLGKGETGGAAALPIWINYMKVALEGVPEVERPRPDGLKLVQNGLGTRQDYHYAEYQPPSPPPIPDWLQEMFANDSSPAMEAETEAIPPAPIAGREDALQVRGLVGRLQDQRQQVLVAHRVRLVERRFQWHVQLPVVGERLLEAREIPLFLDGVGRHEAAEHVREEAVAQVRHHLRGVVGLEDVVAQAVDLAPLVVRDVVVLEQLLADVEVAGLDLALRALDASCDDTGFDRLALGHLQAVHDGAHLVTGEDPHQRIVQAQVEAR